MFKLIIFLDDYEAPIIIPLVSKIKHELIDGDKVLTFEYPSLGLKGVFFIDKIKGYTIYEIDDDKQ